MVFVWVALCLALVMLALSWHLRRRVGAIGEGRVIFDDSGALRRDTRALYAPRYRLSGKPDYLLRVGGAIIPVELKSTPAPAQPYRGHVLQLAAYCLLVEEALGSPPPYGIIRYADEEFRVPYTPQLKAELLAVMQEMRAALRGSEAHRNHAESARCARCAVRASCDERLA